MTVATTQTVPSLDVVYLAFGECETGLETSYIWPVKVEPGT